MADLITLQTGFVVYRPLANGFSAPQLYRQVLLRARISYGNSVCLSAVLPSVTTRYGFSAR